MAVTESSAPAKKERWSYQWKELFDEVITSGLCTGCAGCVIACPHDVIAHEHEPGCSQDGASGSDRQAGESCDGSTSEPKSGT